MRTLRTLLPITLLLCAVFVAGCDSSDPDEFRIEDYLGTYSGSITTTSRIGSNTTTSTTPVTVKVERASTAGRARLTIDAGPLTPGGEDPEPIVFEGSYDDSGAQLSLPDGTTGLFRIDPKGRISGNGSLKFFDVILDMNASGRASSQKFDLTIESIITTGSDEAPAGSKVTIAVAATRAS